MQVVLTGRVGPERGASLVSLLLVVVVLGALAALAVTALPNDPSGTASPLPGRTPSSGGATPGAPRSPAAGAADAACTSTARTLAASVAAKQAVDGAFPATVEEMVAAGYLASAPSVRGREFSLEAVGGRPTGKVLVNGLPSEQGCAAAPVAGG